MIIAKLENPPTTRDKAILSEITGNKAVEIRFIQGFYHKEFYSLLQQVSGGEGILAFNIDLEDYSKDIIAQLYQSQDNAYALFFNTYIERFSPFIFKICRTDLDKFKIEYAYKNNIISRETRNYMHSLLWNFTKTHFFEDRRLYNLSSHWDCINADFEKIETLQSKYPKIIHIGILNECNTSCPHCPWFSLVYQQMHTNDYFKTKKQLSSDKVYEILDFANKGKSRVVFSGPGEPLLDSNLLDYVKYAREIGIDKIGLATNGILLDETKFKELFEAGVHYFEIVFLFVKEVRDRYESNFIESCQKALKNIVSFLKSHKNIARIECSICYDIEFFGSALDLVLIMQDCRDIICHIVHYDRNDQYWIGKLNNKRHSCALPFANLYVFPDGSCGFCETQRAYLGKVNVKDFSLGNIYENNLEEIWHSKKHKQILSCHLQLNFDNPAVKICENCDKWWNEIGI